MIYVCSAERHFTAHFQTESQKAKHNAPQYIQNTKHIMQIVRGSLRERK
jgi:hypothetical protein